MNNTDKSTVEWYGAGYVWDGSMTPANYLTDYTLDRALDRDILKRRTYVLNRLAKSNMSESEAV